MANVHPAAASKKQRISQIMSTLSCEQVIEWLHLTGLTFATDFFKYHKIDGDALVQLEESDLRQPQGETMLVSSLSYSKDSACTHLNKLNRSKYLYDYGEQQQHNQALESQCIINFTVVQRKKLLKEQKKLLSSYSHLRQDPQQLLNSSSDYIATNISLFDYIKQRDEELLQEERYKMKQWESELHHTLNQTQMQIKQCDEQIWNYHSIDQLYCQRQQQLRMRIMQLEERNYENKCLKDEHDDMRQKVIVVVRDYERKRERCQQLETQLALLTMTQPYKTFGIVDVLCIPYASSMFSELAHCLFFFQH